MKRDPYGRPQRSTPEEVKAAADRAVSRSVTPKPSKGVTKNKGGRPATGRDPHLTVRIPRSWKDLLARMPAGARATFVREAMRHSFEQELNRRSLEERQSMEESVREFTAETLARSAPSARPDTAARRAARVNVVLGTASALAEQSAYEGSRPKPQGRRR